MEEIYETIENAREDIGEICKVESTLDDLIYAAGVDVDNGIGWKAGILETLETARDNVRTAKMELQKKIKELEGN